MTSVWWGFLSYFRWRAAMWLPSTELLGLTSCKSWGGQASPLAAFLCWWGCYCLLKEITSSQCIPCGEGLGDPLSRGSAAQSPPNAEPASSTAGAGLGARLPPSRGWQGNFCCSGFVGNCCVQSSCCTAVSWNNPCSVFLQSWECTVKLYLCLSHRNNFLDSLMILWFFFVSPLKYTRVPLVTAAQPVNNFIVFLCLSY